MSESMKRICQGLKKKSLNIEYAQTISLAGKNTQQKHVLTLTVKVSMNTFGKKEQIHTTHTAYIKSYIFCFI